MMRNKIRQKLGTETVEAQSEMTQDSKQADKLEEHLASQADFYQKFESEVLDQAATDAAASATFQKPPAHQPPISARAPPGFTGARAEAGMGLVGGRSARFACAGTPPTRAPDPTPYGWRRGGDVCLARLFNTLGFGAP